MSHLIRRPNYSISQRQFSHLPEIPNVVHGQRQATASAAALSFSGSSASSVAPGLVREEGCLVTGVIDYTLEKTHMVSAVRNEKRQAEKVDVESFLHYYLAVVPVDFCLDDSSNLTWLLPQLHAHHDRYATIAICPSLHDLEFLAERVETNNASRLQRMGQHPGHVQRDLQHILDRPELNHEYELIVLWPQHFLVQGTPIIVKHDDGQFHPYYTAPDHRLHRTSDVAGPALLPFSRPGYRSETDRLNPFLVYLAAHLRMRRFRRVCDNPMDAHTGQLVQAMDRLHNALMALPSVTDDLFSRMLSLEGQGSGGDSAPGRGTDARSSSSSGLLPRSHISGNPGQAYKGSGGHHGQSHQLGPGQTGQSIGDYFLDLMAPRFEEPWKSEELSARPHNTAPDSIERMQDWLNSSVSAA